MGRLHFTMFFFIVCNFRESMEVHPSSCKEAERAALLNLKNTFVDSWNLLGSWRGDDCCSWYGVTCDNVTSNVYKLDLRAVTGYLEAGEVSPALLELKYLTYLDLSGNSFNASGLPEFIGSLEQLRYLNLSCAELSGRVPRSLGNLKHLVTLDLSNDLQYFDYMETNSLNWVSKLENLQYLDLSGMNISQALDSLDKLINLPSLSVLNLASCNLGNSHLVIGNTLVSSTTLQRLDLSANLFSGPFPHFIQNLTSLTFHDLSMNQFKSSVPSWLANKTKLEYLSLRSNHFNRMDGGIMNTITHLCSLKYLDLSNNQLQEEMSKSFVDFSRCSVYDLEFLSLRNNTFTSHLSIKIGTFSSLQHLDLSLNNLEILPPSLGELSSLVSLDLSHNNLSVVNQTSLANLSSLKSLDISSNSFLYLNLSSDWFPPFQLKTLLLQPCKMNITFPKWILSQKLISKLDLSDTWIFGPLPSNIVNTMPSLSSLRLANNHINGSIPRSLCELTSLNILDLRQNRLSGMIPDCWANSPIVGLTLSSNRLFGPIPNSLTKLGNLQVLSLYNNSLEGEIPLSLSNCVDLMVLDVGKNNLNGEIPTWSGTDFSFLKILILRGNRFTGIIPSQLCSATTLQIIDLSSNNLSGFIPQCFGNFEGMGSTLRPSVPHKINATTDPDEWSAAEVIKGRAREYTINLHLLVNMDLSSNNLVGVIPTEITNLALLLSLNLSNNHLYGTIPKEMGRMTDLESLDLSHNNLSGSIPESLAALSFLSTMNVSFNNLQGKIPIGHTLASLDGSSYMGNSVLCGHPLQKKCFGDGSVQSPTGSFTQSPTNNALTMKTILSMRRCGSGLLLFWVWRLAFLERLEF